MSKKYKVEVVNGAETEVLGHYPGKDDYEAIDKAYDANIDYGKLKTTGKQNFIVSRGNESRIYVVDMDAMAEYTAA